LLAARTQKEINGGKSVIGGSFTDGSFSVIGHQALENCIILLHIHHK
jgi:hypothetical protein